MQGVLKNVYIFVILYIKICVAWDHSGVVKHFHLTAVSFCVMICIFIRIIIQTSWLQANHFSLSRSLSLSYIKCWFLSVACNFVPRLSTIRGLKWSRKINFFFLDNYRQQLAAWLSNLFLVLLIWFCPRLAYWIYR